MTLNKPLRILLVTNSMILFSTAMLGPIYALFVEKVGGSLLDAGFAGGVFALAAGITVIFSGRYSDKIKQSELVVVFGYIIIGSGYLLYTQVNSIWMLLLVQVLVGFGEAIYSPAFDSIYSQHLSLTKAARQWGAWEATNYFSIAIGAVFGGFIATVFGFKILFFIMATLCFASAVYIIRLPRKTL